MKEFYIDTTKKLKEIFKDHCNLSTEQFEELREELVFLVTDYQEEEPKEEVEKRINYLTVVIDFLYNTGAITLCENYDLHGLVDEIKTEGEKP